MEEYQERVLVEQKELSEKIFKLVTFLVNYEKVITLFENDWCYLNRQLEIMIEYNRILVMRLRPNPTDSISYCTKNTKD